MKVLNEASLDSKGKYKPGNTYILVMDRQEAQTLLNIAEAAFNANKRRSTFRTWWKKLENCLECF